MKKSNENILYGLLKANFSQADNDDMVVRKRSCLNAIVICGMLARLLLSDLFDICERITASPEALAPHLIRYDDWDAFAPFIAADGENYVAEEEAIEATAYWLNRSAKEG